MLNKLRPWAVPIGLLVVLVASFGLLIPWLGFYWDDWSVLMTARMRDLSGFWEYYAYDRPVSAWTYVVFMPLLRTNPVTWQIFSLLLRWGTSAALWWSLANLWPKNRRETATAAFLFAIYPLFDQQAISVAFSQHWICYFLYCVSLALMILAWRKKGPAAWILTLLAVLAAGLQMFTMEYFVGLELLRPFVLWILVSENKSSRIKTVLLRWLPYLAALVIFVLWRLFILKLPTADPNAPSLLFGLLSSPLKTVPHLVQLILQDLENMFVTAWADLVKTDTIQLDDRFNLFTWAMAAAVTTGLFFFLRHFTISEKDARRWYVQAMLLGMLAVLFGVMPIWLTDRQVVTGMHSDRFGMPAMLGASLVVAGFINWLGISQNKQILFISLLVGLAAGQHLRTENDYRWDWVTQNRFYWQLAWRAPSIQPNTSIFAEGEFLSNMSGNAITTGIDLLYAPPQHPTYTLPYYFYSLGRDYSYRMADFLKGIPTHENNYRIYHFNGSTRAALVIDYSPDKNNCLHILRPDDAGLPNLPPYSAQALPNSNLALIQPGPSQPGYPPADIYGPQPDLPWCRIYQQAELARQTGDWQKVASLGDQAALKGFSLKNSSSNTPYEWLPFVEAYARTGHIDSASRISIDIVAKDARMNVYMCQFWNKIHDGMPRTDFSGVFTSLGCNAK